MSYKKNEDGSYTCYQYMKFDGTMLEATAQTLETAQELLKGEVKAYRSYPLKKTDRKFYSPGREDSVDYIYTKED